MIVTVTNMTYDNPYFIDLTSFSPGRYFFDWNQIDSCQKSNRESELIDCNGMKFYQLQLKTDAEKRLPGDFVHNKIKPYNLEQFRQK